MSDGRSPGPLGTAVFARPTGIARTASFALPPPLGFGASPVQARLPGEIAPMGVPREVPGGRPLPVPQPRPAPTPLVGRAAAFLGPVGPRDRIIVDYYTKCGLETLGPGQVAVDTPGRYTMEFEPTGQSIKQKVRLRATSAPIAGMTFTFSQTKLPRIATRPLDVIHSRYLGRIHRGRLGLWWVEFDTR
jgi:hypothetical protein